MYKHTTLINLLFTIKIHLRQPPSSFLQCNQILMIPQSNNKIIQLLLQEIRMSSYHNILSEFQKLGFYEDSTLQQSQLFKALDKLAVQNAGFRQYDRDLAEELWDHSQKQNPRTIKLRSFIHTFQQADNILQDQAGNIKNELQGQNNQSRRNQIQQQLNDLINDHKQLTAPFRISPMTQSHMIAVSDRGNNSRISDNYHDSVLFANEPGTFDRPSTDLKIVLIVAVVWLFFEFINMFHKHHFYNLIACCFVLSIFFLNYFDKKYIQFLLVFVAATCVFDIVWMGVHSSDYWQANRQTIHSTIQTDFLKYIVVMTAILICIKIFILAILFKYRKNTQNIRKSVSIFGKRFKLDGRPTYNPFTTVLGGVEPDFF